MRRSSARGFTLIETLVSIGLFSIITLAIASVMSSLFRSVAVEQRAAIASLEARNALALLSSELHSSSAVSPYLLGGSLEATNCASALAVTPTSLKFITVEDDPNSSGSGVAAYYVGYRYDASKKALLRGEIAKPESTNCALPAGDPTAPASARTLVENIVQIDSNNDAVPDPVFTLSSDGALLFSAAMEINRQGRTIRQNFTTAMHLRTR